MSQSLSSKLRDLRRSLNKKNRPKAGSLFDLDALKLIARYMPRTEDDLRKLIPDNVMSVCGEQILEVTKVHGRDQDMFEDCVKEIDAFLRGGLPGITVLDRVYKNILKQYEMVIDMEEVFDACKIYLHSEQNRLRRKRDTDDDDIEFQHADVSMHLASEALRG
jgi:hypothetical protein